MKRLALFACFAFCSTSPAAAQQLHLRANLSTSVIGISSLAFSPEGKTLACGGSDAALVFQGPSDKHGKVVHGDHLNLFDVRTAKRTVISIGQHETIKSVTFSPDGKLMAISGIDPEIVLWDLSSGSAKASLRDPTDAFGWFICSAFSPDSKVLATGGFHSRVKLWNVANLEKIGELRFKEETIDFSLAFSPDGKKLATATGNGVGVFGLYSWDVATRKIEASFNGHTNTVRSVDYNRSGKTLVSSSDDGTIRLWDAATCKNLASSERSDGLLCVLFTPNGKLLIVATATAIEICDPRTLKVLSRAKVEYVTESLAISSDGKILATGGTEIAAGLTEKVQLWSIHGGEMKASDED
jgi:WD40 repeat protein